MMGTIVLSMLLSWFCAVTALTLLSGGGKDSVAEEPAPIATRPHPPSVE